MLSEENIELLTAYVDGELTSRQREEVLRLINKSAEARELLRQLQENAHKVKQLALHKVQPSLVDEIVLAIEEQKVRAKPQQYPRRRRSLVPAILVGLAASILVFAVGILGWIAWTTDKGGNPVVVNNDRKNDPKPEHKGPEQPIETPKKEVVNPLLAKMVEGTFKDFGSPVPETNFLASFPELKKGGKREAELVRNMNVEKSVQLDVVVKKNSDAMTRLREVLKGQGINVVADPAAAKVVDDKKTEYLIYADNLTSSELAKVMNELADNYVVPGATGMNQKNVASPYQKLKLTSFEDEEKAKLAKAIGVDPKSLERKDVKANPKAERSILVLPAAGKQSKEVQQFLNQARETRPEAVQVLIRIRQE